MAVGGLVFLATTLLIAAMAGVFRSEPVRPEVAAGASDCPVTLPSDGFVPPEPYAAQPSSEGARWYGTPELWTALNANGEYTRRKSVWWSARFMGGATEQAPDLRIAWERLDQPGMPSLVGPPATNAYTDDDGWFMISGIDPDTAGCWRVTATYRGAELSYVYEVAEDRHR